MSDSQVMDLDALAVELEVKIGGKLFTAREASVETNKEILRAMPEGLDRDSDDPADQLRNLDAIYPQLSRLLTDKETSKPPAKEHLERHLTTSGLKALMKRLNPEDDESGNDASPRTSTG